MYFRPRAVLLGFVLAGLCPLLSLAWAGAPDVDFHRDIEPLFRAHCYLCHGPKQQMNELRLDRRQDALRGGHSGPLIQAGNSNASELILRVTGQADRSPMPPVGERLTADQIATLRSWIDQGAPWPQEEMAAATDQESNGGRLTHWSLQPIRRPPVPATRSPERVRNSIDAFILARLEDKGIQPSPEADKRTLIRRLSLDLIGLPPSPDEVDKFLADEGLNAYERLVENLLRSPHFGEKWARHWLDQAHYADSDGYDRDLPRPHAWRWRHWVIESLNRDMPFDKFTVEQIAGDLLPNATPEQKAATGFFRNTLSNRESGAKLEEFRFEKIVDRTNTLGTVWLGLTVGCAQCHDHKYDPISQKEYYQLFAFFNSAEELNVEAPLPGELGPYLKHRDEYYRKRQELLEQYGVTEIQPEWERRLLAAYENPGKWTDWDETYENFEKKVDHGLRILRTPPAQRNRHQQDAVTNHLLTWYHQVIGKEAYKERGFPEWKKELRALRASFPDVSMAQTITQSPEPRTNHIHLRGDYRAKGIEVSPRTPGVLHPFSPAGPEASRLDLARWLVSWENPLTARVIVNRLWQEYFGQGLVTTSDNFGTQGEKPAHPELLDWLASELMDSGWSMKRIHRLVVTSATYRRSSKARSDLVERDPDNRLLARQIAFRLPAELLRDSTLAASGLLYPAIGGRNVFPPQPESVLELKLKYDPVWEESRGKDLYKRGLYIHYQRTTPYPFLQNFDAPDASTPACRRGRSNTPLQALNLLNDPVFFEAAQFLALRILKKLPAASFHDRLDYGFRLCLGRPPSANESEVMLSYLTRQKAILEKEPESVTELLPWDIDGADQTEAAAWVGLSRVLLNLDEFLTRE